MKKNLGTITKTIAILVSISLLAACGAADTTRGTGTNSTHYSPDNDTDTTTADSINVEDLGTEEYFIAEIAPSATDEEKQKKNIHYLERSLERDIEAIPSVIDASIALSGTGVIEQANILLDLEEELAKDSIVTIAEVVANATELSTDNISILDADGTVLYIESRPLPDNDI